MKILVFGGSGFLGTALMRHLEHAGIEVCTCSTAELESIAPGYCLDALPFGSDRFDAVVNLAAVIPYAAMDRYSDCLLRVNSLLPYAIARKFVNARFIQASSVSVYGTPLHDPVDESHPYNQPSAYGLSKLSAEILCSAHLNAVFLRFPSLYGPGMKAKTFIPLVVGAALKDQRISVYGDGSRMQNYLYIDDAARLIITMLDHSFCGPVNACLQPSVTNMDVARSIAGHIGEVELVTTGDDSAPSCNYVSRHQADLFQGMERTPLSQGLAELIRSCAG